MPGKALEKAKALSARALNGQNKKVWDLFLEDWTQQEIAAELGISQPRVSQILRTGAGEVDLLPREETLRRRLAQIEAKISYWSAIAMNTDLPMSSRYAADKRAADWWDRRARLTGENAPDKHFIQEGETIRYVIEGLNPEALE